MQHSNRHGLENESSGAGNLNCKFNLTIRAGRVDRRYFPPDSNSKHAAIHAPAEVGLCVSTQVSISTAAGNMVPST